MIGNIGRVTGSVRPPSVSLFTVHSVNVATIVLSGGNPLIVPPHLKSPKLRAVSKYVKAIILSGGGDIHPAKSGEKHCGPFRPVDEERSHAEITFARWTIGEESPVLSMV